MEIKKVLLMCSVITTLCFSTFLPYMPALQHKTGDEPIPVFKPIPYMGSRALGDTVGTTWYDLQANGTPGMRVGVDDSVYIHVVWMKMNAAQSLRCGSWNFRFSPGVWYGESQATPSWSGFVQMDITDDNRTVIAYHYNDGSNYYSWIDIDDGQGWGSFGNNMGNNNCGAEEHIWPYIAVKGNNITMVTGDNVPAGDPYLHKYQSTDLGQTFSYVAQFDSCTCISQFVRKSPFSDKVVHVWTQSIALEYSGQLISQTSCDVKYELSTDGGATWGAPVNVTNYQPPGTMVNGDTTDVAYTDPCAVFDESDNLHIVWTITRVWVASDTIYYKDRSKIKHWDEISGNITTVNSPSIYYTEPDGWWMDTNPHQPTGASGAWRIVCDHPQIAVDTINDYLICLWSGNDDTTDVSAGGYLNGEIYEAYSTDNGATWCDYINLTNTRTPGAAAGACMDEDYMTVAPYAVDSRLYLTYIEDKDAGSAPYVEGTYTENPVRVWEYTLPWGITESGFELLSKGKLSLAPNPATQVTSLSYALRMSGHVKIDLYDVTGRLVKHLINECQTAGSYAVNISTTDLVNGTYFVVMDTPEEHCTGTLVVIH